MRPQRPAGSGKNNCSPPILNETIAARPDDTAKFLAAEILGLRYAMGHKDDVVKVAQEATGFRLDDPRPAFMYDLAVKQSAREKLNAFSSHLTQRRGTWFVISRGTYPLSTPGTLSTTILRS